VPIAKQSREAIIRDTKIANDSDWQRRVVAQFQHYKKRALYFINVMKLLERCFNFKTVFTEAAILAFTIRLISV